MKMTRIVDIPRILKMLFATLLLSLPAFAQEPPPVQPPHVPSGTYTLSQISPAGTSDKTLTISGDGSVRSYEVKDSTGTVVDAGVYAPAGQGGDAYTSEMGGGSGTVQPAGGLKYDWWDTSGTPFGKISPKP